MRVPVFRSGHQGMGMTSIPVPGVREDSYAHCYGSVDMRTAGAIRPGPAMTFAAWPSAFATDPPQVAVTWRDSNNRELILCSAEARTFKIQNNVATLDSSLVNAVTGGCIHDDGSGVQYYYTCYTGLTTAPKVQRRNKAGTVTSTTNLFAERMASLFGDLYLSAYPSATATAASGICKIPAGTDPGTASMPARTVVGFADSPIVNIVGVRRQVIVLKNEGIFRYDRATDQWINLARWLETAPHPQTGWAYCYRGSDLIVFLGFGGAVICDGDSAERYDLYDDYATPDQDSPPQTITAAATLKSSALLVTSRYAKLSRGQAGTSGAAPQRLIFAKSTDNGATWATDYGSQVTDADETTEAVLDALSAATGYMLIGFDEPFAGWRWTLSQLNSNAATLSAEISTSGGFSSIPIIDTTINDAGTVSLARGGRGQFDAGGIVSFSGGQNPLNRNPSWAKTQITVAGTQYTKYWVRLRWSGNLSATVRISRMELIPYRPDALALPDGFGGVKTTLLEQWQVDVGLLPHVLILRDADGHRAVHDLGSGPVLATDDISIVLYARIGDPSGDSRYGITMLGKRGYHNILLPEDDRGDFSAWPYRHDRSGVVLPMRDLAALTGREGPFRLTELLVDGRDWLGTGYLLWRFDDGYPWRLAGQFDALPARMPVASGDVGDRLQVAVLWNMASVQFNPGQPQVNRITAEVEPQPGVTKRRLPRQSPPVI